MKLNELLDSVGLGVVEFSKLADVNRKTVTRWLSKDIDADDKMILVIDKYKSEMTHDQSESVPVPMIAKQVETVKSEAWEVTHKNIALSRIKYGREGWTIDRVASLFNLSVSKYNHAVKDTINHCQNKSTTFHELRQ